jgi:hypothetical protein
LLHGYLHNDQEYIDILNESKLYFIPIINVDSVKLISENFISSGNLFYKRKNTNPSYNNDCDLLGIGVDLNRNYDHNFGDE